MAVTQIDLCSALIEVEREHVNNMRAPVTSQERIRPHDQHVYSNLFNACAISLELLGAGCLIEKITLGEFGVYVLLHRAPPAGRFGRHCDVVRFELGRERRYRRSVHNDVRIEWRVAQ